MNSSLVKDQMNTTQPISISNLIRSGSKIPQHAQIQPGSLRPTTKATSRVAAAAQAHQKQVTMSPITVEGGRRGTNLNGISGQNILKQGGAMNHGS